MPYLAFLAICLLFGSNFILMSVAGQALGPVALAAARVGGAALLLGAIWASRRPRDRMPLRLWPAAVVVALLSNTVPYTVQPYLIRHGEMHSFFGVMVAFTPLLTMAVSIPMLGVWPTARQLAGVVVGLGFLGLLMLDGSERGLSPGMLALACTVPLSYAVGNTFLRRHLSGAPVAALSVVMLMTSVALLTPLAAADPLLRPLGLEGPADPHHWPAAIAAALTLGVLGTGATMWLFIGLVQNQGPLFASMVTYVVPVVAMMWGLFDHEQITTKQVVAIAGVLSMVALVQYGAVGAAENEKRAAPEPDPAPDHADSQEELACAGASR